MWIEREHLYLLHASQKSAFAQTVLHSEFSDFYDLAVGVAKPDPLNYFQREIQEASDRYLAARTPFRDGSIRDSGNIGRGGRRTILPSRPRRMSDHNPFFPENDDSDNPEIEAAQQTGQRKRKRTLPNSATADNTSCQLMLGNSMLQPVSKDNINSSPQVRKSLIPPGTPRPVHLLRHHPPNQSSSARAQSFVTPVIDLEPAVYIKTEEEQYQSNYAKLANPDEIVNVFIGNATKPFCTTRTAISKSPILSAQIQEDPKHGRFIMHPSLAGADKFDTLAMLQFMQEGEYSPKSVRRSNSNAPPYMLSGKSFGYQYNDEVIRAGRLYNLAKVFQVQGFIQHILEKIKSTEYVSYSNVAIMQCTILVYQDAGGNGRMSRDGMETWLIKVLADRFKDIMKSEMEQNLFWDMEQRTARRKVIRDVFALCAENYHNIGGIPIVIQDE